MNLIGEGGELRITLEITRKETGKRREAYAPKPEPAEQPQQWQAYASKSEKLGKAIQRLQGEATTLREQITALEARIAAEERAKRKAALERDLLLAQQALTLAIAQEQAIAEEMEVLDIAFFAVLALTKRH